ncbi:unnamed protein product [Rotaria sp. Silwood1]|nr:unnamed protein product [Rotaria sp. Silwood1]
MSDQILEKSSTKSEINLTFPDQFSIPTLPNALLQDIEAGAIHNYPTRKQFDDIGTAIVRKLKLPLTKDNVGIWKDAIQIKLKRKRFENRDNEEVKAYQSKYSRFGSGRPVKKMIGEVAERDRQKQIMLVSYDDDTLTVIQNKAKKLRDDPQLDLNIRLQLWKETLHVRRKAVRNQTTSEILEEFPGYKDPVLIFEEVKMMIGADLRAVVRRQIPILLERIIATPAFITDSPPIQLIRVLCRQFDESIHHLYCNTSPSSPYPSMVFTDNTITIYTDFLSIVSTTSPDDGLALILAMYVVFELNFPKNGRAIRFLYAIMFGDTRYLSNKMRTLIKEKNIEIYTEQNRKISESTNLISNSHSAISNDTHSSSQASSNLSSTPLEDVYPLHTNNLNINTTITSTEPDDMIRKSSSNVDCQKQSEHFSKKVVKKKTLTCNSDDDSQDGINSLDENLHVGTRQKTKRKRRY